MKKFSDLFNIENLDPEERSDLFSQVAENPNTPIETLKLLAKDEDWLVRSFVAINSSTPIETLNLLAGDENRYVRYGVAQNPNTPPEILNLLAKDEDVDIREYAEKNLKQRNYQ